MLEQFAEKLGNKIFAIETNVDVLNNKLNKAFNDGQLQFMAGAEMLTVLESIKASIEQMKELKEDLENGD